MGISITKNMNLSQREFLKTVEFVLTLTFFFSFNNSVYKQTFGTPIESSLSLIIIAVILLILQDLENHILNELKLDLPSYVNT